MYLEEYRDFIYLKDSIPTLDEVRGKIFVIRSGFDYDGMYNVDNMVTENMYFLAEKEDIETKI